VLNLGPPVVPVKTMVESPEDKDLIDPDPIPSTDNE
jgi:hypothetical protein